MCVHSCTRRVHRRLQQHIRILNLVAAIILNTGEGRSKGLFCHADTRNCSSSSMGFDSGSGSGSSNSGSNSCPSSPRHTPPPRSDRHHRHHHHDRHHNLTRRSQPAGLAPTPCESCPSARPCSSKLPTTSATSATTTVCTTKSSVLLESGLLTSHKVSLASSHAQRQGK